MGRKSSGLNYRGASGFYRQSDRTGFTVRAWDTEQQWDSLIVEKSVWEARQPQDFVRGVKDDQTIPLPRPLGPPIWDGPLYTTTTSACSIGATFIPLQSSAGFSSGDNVGIMMDNGILYNTTISGNPTSTGININGSLPYTVASGNSVMDYRAQL